MRSFNSFKGGLGGIRIGPGFITPVIKYLIIVNVVMYIIQSTSSLDIIGAMGLNPKLFFSDFPNFLYQPFTYMFLHGGFLHLTMNMLVLWMFGAEIEQTWGTKSFLFYYFLCGFGGALLSLMFSPNAFTVIVGASGAIFGILAAYWLMFPNRKIMMFPIFIPMKVKYAIPLVSLIVFLFGGANVAHLAHLGGALIGLAYLKLDWRIFKPLNWWRKRKFKHKVAKQEKNRLHAAEVMQRVDSILDKINEVGFNNISAEDQKFLNDASKILSNKDKNGKTKENEAG